MDKAKDALEKGREKLEDVVDAGLDKADELTKGKFSDQIDKAQEMADKIDGKTDSAGDSPA
ncbi:MAG: antitoxin [Acidimicrobiales bacterium]